MQDQTIAALRDLLAMEDDIGVITVSIGFTPSSYADGPTGPDDVKARLRKLGAGHDQQEAIQERIDELSEPLARLMDPHGEGRGRYLAAEVTGDRVIEHTLQVDLPVTVELDDGPVLRHLLEALDEHEHAGTLLLHQNEAKLFELSFRGHEELEDWEFRVGEIVLGDDKTGPGPSGQTQAGNPVNPGGTSHKDRQQSRVQENQDRFLRDVAGDVRTLCESRGLGRLVLVGQAHERTVVREAFGSGNGVRLLDVDRVASGDVRDTLDAAQERLSEEHAEHELDLVTTARDAAKSDGRGALGPADVTAALREGRVDHLLLSPDLELSGYVTDEGMLIFDQDTPGGQDATPESRFVHRMIERTITTDGKVTPVDGAAAEALEELGGVAAILRW
jgi:peptide subunit release factor 1 (eRF1)